MDHPTLPDNLTGRLKRLYVDKRTFTDDAGKSVNYERLVLGFTVKGEPFELEFKLDKKDRMILSLTDSEEQSL